MGLKFSKNKKKAEEPLPPPRDIGSAPARLEGLDGTSPTQGNRPLTPDLSKLSKSAGTQRVESRLAKKSSELKEARDEKKTEQKSADQKAETPAGREESSKVVPAKATPAVEDVSANGKGSKKGRETIEPAAPKAVAPPTGTPTPPVQGTAESRKLDVPAGSKVAQKEQPQTAPEAPTEKPLTTVVPLSYDDTPVGVKRGPKKVDMIGAQTDGKKLAAEFPSVITIPDDAKVFMTVLDETTVRQLYSADWKDREHSLTTISRHLTNATWLKDHNTVAVFKTLTDILGRSLRDKVAPLYFESLDLVNLLVTTYSHLIPQKELHAGTDLLVPVILHRCGNVSGRIHEASTQALLTLAGQPEFGCQYIGPFALAPLSKRSSGASQTAQMVGRLDLLCQLLVTYRTTQGLGVEDVLAFTKPALEMPDDKVRQSAVRVISELYRLRKMAGDELEIEKHTGPVKPALMQMIQRRFSEVAEEVKGGGSPAASAAAEDGTIKVFGKQLPPLATGGGGGSSLPPLGVGRSFPAVDGARNKSPLPRGGRPPPSRGGLVSPRGDPPSTPPGGHRAVSPLLRETGSTPRSPAPLRTRSPSPMRGPDDGLGTPTGGGRNMKSPLRGGDGSGRMLKSPQLSLQRRALQSPGVPSSLDQTEEQLLDYIEQSIHN